MPTTTLTFPNDINVSVQIGDIIYYSPTTTTGIHDTAGTVVELGNVIIVDNASSDKTIENIRNGEKVNFMDLRNKLVTAKNNNLNDWELETPKEIRAHSVKDVCKAYKSAISNLKAGNIKYFKLNYKSFKN